MAANGFQFAEALRFLVERCPGLAADPHFAAALAQVPRRHPHQLLRATLGSDQRRVIASTISETRLHASVPRLGMEVWRHGVPAAMCPSAVLGRLMHKACLIC